LSFLEKPKDQIINIVTQSIRNPNAGINAIGLWGSKGLGKTSIVKSISEALNRPYRSISLGGESDSSVLTGHGFTYVGSNPGRIIEILRETKCMNPIILVDELDKVSQTYQGKEIIGTLIHLTDMTTNSKYTYDRYFSGIEFDLSKVLFIFTYNDPEKVDKILADRLFKIKVENYNIKEKLEITKQHIIKNVLQEFNFTENDISFGEECINYIVNSSNNDEGMRDIKRKIEIITSRINTLLLTSKEDNVINLKYKNLYSEYSQLPLAVKKEHVDTFLEESISSSDTSSAPPFGMYT
jgi:ATP-dependent Lon protease